MIVHYSCPECGHKLVIDCTPEIPAQTYGPPESCYPGEGPDIDPDTCDKCGLKLDLDDVFDNWPEPDFDDREDRDDE